MNKLLKIGMAGGLVFGIVKLLKMKRVSDKMVRKISNPRVYKVNNQRIRKNKAQSASGRSGFFFCRGDVMIPISRNSFIFSLIQNRIFLR